MNMARTAVAAVAASILVLTPIVALALPDPISLPARSSDTNYTVQDGAVTFVWPKNWTAAEKYFESLNGSKVGVAVMGDQSELQNRRTKNIYVLWSTASGIFDLPTSIVSRLSSKDLVNYYISQIMRTSIGPKIIAVSTKSQGNDTVYSVEWSEFTPEMLLFINVDRFLFHKGMVYMIHGDYATVSASARPVIISTLDSVIPKDVSP